MKKTFLSVAVLGAMLAASAASAATYTWLTPAGGDYSVAANWTPARTTPAASDVLIFDGTAVPGTLAITNIVTETIAELHCVNNTTVTFTPATSSKTITIAGGPSAADVEVAAGSKFSFVHTAAVFLTVALQTGAKADISGDVIFTGTGAGGANRFTTVDALGIIFESGSTFQFAPGGSGAGNPFGTTPNTGVEFKSGSTGYQGGTTTGSSTGTGSAMQAGTLPVNVIQWDAGSTYYNWSSVMAGSGRTYANVVLDNRGAVSNNTGASTLTINGNLTYKGTAAAAVNFNLTANPAVVVTGDYIVETNGRVADTAALVAESRYEIGGNITIAGPNASMSSNAFRVWTLTGTGTQTVTLPATGVIFPALRINKASGGVVLASDASVANTLDLVSGNVDTGVNTLSVNGAITRTAGQVIGNLSKGYTIGATGSTLFPVGTATLYTPVTVNFTVGTTTAGSLAVATTSTQSPFEPAAVLGVNRFWTLTPTTLAGFTADLTFQYDTSDIDGGANENTFAAFRYNGASWDTIPSTPNAAANTVTATAVTGFSPWAIWDTATSVREWKAIDQ